jgi:hypothetical protein
MNGLIFPKFDIKVQKKEGKLWVFDPVRRKNVLLTPEEWVRQHALNFLITERNIPKSRIAIEKEWTINGLTKRTDLLVYNEEGEIWLLAEFKRMEVELNKESIKQIQIYNKELKAKVIWLTNGREQVVYDCNENKFIFEIF